MNHFEEDVQEKRNDAIDSGIGFVVSFIFFALVFIVAQAVDVASLF
ncbi:membrane protein [Alkalihalobacillus alcalophilus ATCC 27647 = CGMCC 1.3604]|uniref:Membrane protein n=1 Tax=Alkalihalobacillus alcalophilus ATCC 27647 = CGMCC 1.3604 TaxID=1218173 RepID=A0A094WQZ1_ALKAL|nr:YqzM family protein [Alkalihalobacillus alcalophilus]KGA98463.1 membrane protein [Alkalihalobacillus alcalophilus ATCC 27647 = CGMCC 1.3604]MED1563344.1 YqzM family protein [Alkalihalobacillus alcalophilus]THG88531.1 membrane protein [Alkalihalobacillus alcalophilus ATCC 27647 = CGMCC 1.3604]